MTRKDSGVLAPDFAADDSKNPPATVEPNRKTMYYVRCLPIPSHLTY